MKSKKRPSSPRRKTGPAKPRPVQRMVLRQLADSIADALLTEGLTDKKAQRLVLEMKGQNFCGSGWCRGAISDVVFRAISQNAELSDRRREGRSPAKGTNE